jgi:hypothetical protein
VGLFIAIIAIIVPVADPNGFSVTSTAMAAKLGLKRGAPGDGSDSPALLRLLPRGVIINTFTPVDVDSNCLDN